AQGAGAFNAGLDGRFIASANASRINPSATPKVTCRPLLTASGEARLRSPVTQANSAANAQAPMISPRLRERFNRPAITPRRSGARSFITEVLLAVWNWA